MGFRDAFWCLEAEGCGGLHAEYELAWKAEGETFFDDPWAAESQMSGKQRLILWVLYGFIVCYTVVILPKAQAPGI